MPPPGVEKPQRFRPRFHWELLACGIAGHELEGMGARELRPSDALIVFELRGLRWHRCLRCDSWIPLPPPERPTRDFPPERDAIELPLRGKPLRDKVVLRLIAINRAFHCLVFGLLAAAILVLAAHQHALRDTFYKVVTDLGGTVGSSDTGLKGKLNDLLRLRST